ncbi:hypothetical protein NL676_024629 [Syzygium grande]|nr:hypothetical protein NL676_024629 [Syzygium grande]
MDPFKFMGKRGTEDGHQLAVSEWRRVSKAGRVERGAHVSRRAPFAIAPPPPPHRIALVTLWRISFNTTPSSPPLSNHLRSIAFSPKA